VVVVVPPGSEGEVGDAVVAVAGGEHRSQSVAAGLALVESELVAIHDAARPLVTPELIDALVEKLALHADAAGVIAAAPLTDTVKRADERRATPTEKAGNDAAVAETIDRDYLWAAQTPQVFRTEVLRQALDTDLERIASATDEAMLVEQAGGKVLIHPSPPENLKVTTELDLRVTELLLARRSA
jgi:2-C-methyl-D-erythritol 4-phosphate cytidylyltransferase